MDNRFDDLTKSLAEGIPRRQALRQLAGLFGGTILGLLAFGTTVHADPCGKGKVPCGGKCCLRSRCCNGTCCPEDTFCCSVTNTCCPNGWLCGDGCYCFPPGTTCY
jgi:hypothetical protein